MFRKKEVAPARMPSEGESQDGITALNNTAMDPNAIARDRERHVTGMAVATLAAAGREADLAPAVAADDKPAIEKKTELAGEEVTVVVPKRRMSEQVQKFGPESRLPRGTPVNKDGTPCQDGQEPYGIIGDIRTAQGILVNRVIPLEVLEGAAAAG